MLALSLSILGLIAAFLAGRRSLVWGCLVVMASGYGYGIIRANLQTAFSHFIFDATLVGLYLSQFYSRQQYEKVGPHMRALRLWTMALIGWPLLLVLLPFQPFLISLVGLRGNMFLIPILLLGSRLRTPDLRVFALGLAGLNLVAFAFGSAEFLIGVERFFPYSPVTMIIYNSNDAASFLRIPATFSHAHVYAGTMLGTIPFLFGAWVEPNRKLWERLFVLLGMVTALLGVLLAATRIGVVTAVFLILIALVSSGLGTIKRLFWMVVIAGLVVLAFSNDRFGRFKSLADSEMVTERVGGSVNRTFLEILADYPIGNGLGGGGTNMPYFLTGLVNRPVSVENEYARILLEQGVVGLGLFLGFAFWFMTNRSAFAKDSWLQGRRMAWFSCLFSMGVSTIGIGMLTSIPNTFLFLLSMGWVSVMPRGEREAAGVLQPARVSVLRTQRQAPAGVTYFQT